MNEEYQEYLNSDIWKEIRRKRLEIDNFQCQICGDPAEHVHHLRYRRNNGVLSPNINSDLVSVCSRCHNIFHELDNMRDRANDNFAAQWRYIVNEETHSCQN